MFKSKRGEMEKKLYQALIALSLVLTTQSLVTACPTCLHGASFIHHPEDDEVGEMEVFQTQEEDEEEQEKQGHYK